MSAAPATIVPVRAGSSLYPLQTPLSKILLDFAAATKKNQNHATLSKPSTVTSSSEPPPPVPGAGPSSALSSAPSSAPVVITEDHLDLTVDIDSDIEDSLSSQSGHIRASHKGDEKVYEIYYDAEDPKDREAWLKYFTKVRKNYYSEAYTTKEELRKIGVERWMKEYVVRRQIPIQNLLHMFGVILYKDQRELDDLKLLPILKVALTRFLRGCDRGQGEWSTPKVSKVVQKLKEAKHIVVLTGAGISTSCGIPDFRSRGGLYAQLASNNHYDLDDPQQMFDINYFRRYPDVFYSFAHQIYPSNFEPSPCHRFIKAMQDRKQLLRNYTQNIDTLEMKAGIDRVLQCHGSFRTASCIQCHVRVPGNVIKDDLLACRVPLCKSCNDAKSLAKLRNPRKKKKKKKRTDGWESDEDERLTPLPPGIMKPDITFFGEKLSDKFDEKFFKDLKKMDFLLIIGTSLRVRPVSEIPSFVPNNVPIVVINKTALTHVKADCQLIGDADIIVNRLARELGWDISPPSGTENATSSKVDFKLLGEVQRTLYDRKYILFEGHDEDLSDEEEEEEEEEDDDETIPYDPWTYDFTKRSKNYKKAKEMAKEKEKADRERSATLDDEDWHQLLAGDYSEFSLDSDGFEDIWSLTSPETERPRKRGRRNLH